MENDRLRALAGAPGPFVSLYIDDTRDTPDAEKQAAARWHAIRTHLEDSGVAERVVGTLERAVLHCRPAEGRRGRAVIAGSEGALINERLDSPPPITVLRISDYPYVLPLLESSASRPPYVFAAVDHLGADITAREHDGVVRETVQGEGFPVHKPSSAGWSGYGDMQHSAEEAVRMNMRATADRITKLADRTHAEIVFVCGEVRSRVDLLAELPHRIAERVVPLPACARGGRAEKREVADLIDGEFVRRRREAVGTVVARYQAEQGRGAGLVAQGLSAVCAALRDGAVETLVVGDLGGTTVVSGINRTMIAPDADALSEFGEAVQRVALADEALPFAAIATDASVVCPGGGVAEGIAAVLRYPRAGVATAEGSTQQAAPR